MCTQGGGEVPTMGQGKSPESLKGRNNGLNLKIYGKLLKYASCLLLQSLKTLGFVSSVTALENLSASTVFTQILKLLIFIYCTLQALSRI